MPIIIQYRIPIDQEQENKGLFLA